MAGMLVLHGFLVHNFKQEGHSVPVLCYPQNIARIESVHVDLETSIAIIDGWINRILLDNKIIVLYVRS